MPHERQAGMQMLLAMLLAQAFAGRVLTLQDAERAAQQRQPQLRAAKATTEAAQSRSDQARSGLLPQVSATAQYQRGTANYMFRPGGIVNPTGTAAGNSTSTVNIFATSVGVSQLFWDFGQTSGRWQASKAAARATADQEIATGQQVVLLVRTAFFDARANRDLVRVARDTLENQQRHYDQIAGFVEEGTRPPIDLSQARADTANAQVALINAENAYATSKALLNQAMGIEGPTDYEVAGDELPPLPDEQAGLEELMAVAVAARPEVASFQEQARAAQLTISAARGGYGPAVSGIAGFAQGGTNLENLGWNASAGVTLTWQLYQGGLTLAQVREAEANLAYAVAEVDLLRQQIRVEVDQARLLVRAAKSSLTFASEALVAAHQRLTQAEGRYQNGVGSVIELGDAQVASSTSAAQVVQAQFRLATARAQLLRALGRA